VKRTFQLAFPNGPFGDPLLVVRPRLSARLLLFDCGDATALGPRQLLAASDVFLSHGHVDHVFGLGRLLRLRLGRCDRPLRIHGPAGTAARVAAHLAGYCWNLVDAYPLDLEVREWDGATLERRRFPAAGGFEPALVERRRAASPATFVENDEMVVEALALDHGGIASLAFRAREKAAYNIDPAALAARGLPTGPWLARVKEALRRGDPPTTPIALPDGGAAPLGELRDALVIVSPGDSLVYAADAAPTEATAEGLAAFARGARRLVVEAHFLEEDAELARRNAHLTARLAGEIARQAGVAAASPIHFSTRYDDRANEVLDEFRAAAAPVPVEELPRLPAPLPEDGA